MKRNWEHKKKRTPKRHREIEYNKKGSRPYKRGEFKDEDNDGSGAYIPLEQVSGRS